MDEVTEPCDHCLSLVQRVNDWRGRHGGSSRWHDVAALLRPHAGIKCLARFDQSPEGESLLHRCNTCGSCWTIVLWSAVNDVNIERADGALIQRWMKEHF